VYSRNLSAGVALNAWFTTNRTCMKNSTHIYMWHEQAIIEWSHRANSIVACCHSAKLCAHAALDFRSQQYYSFYSKCWRGYICPFLYFYILFVCSPCQWNWNLSTNVVNLFAYFMVTCRTYSYISCKSKMLELFATQNDC